MRCGTYRIAETAARQLQDAEFRRVRMQVPRGIENGDQLEEVIGEIRRARDVIIGGHSDRSARAARQKTAATRRALRATCRRRSETEYPDGLPIAYARDDHESTLLLSEANRLGLIRFPNGITDNVASVQLTLDKGWERIRALQIASRESWQAFVAMWFDARRASI